MLRFAVLSVTLFGALTANADTFTFNVIPSWGIISAPPGGTAGWGYIIDNLSSSLYLEMTNLDAGVFSNGTPVSLFDFPILAPGDIVTVPWSLDTSGLYQFSWDSGVDPTSLNSGTFRVTGQFWNGVPYVPGSAVSGAPLTVSQTYEITAGASTVPEPSSLGLLSAITVAVALIRLMKRRKTGSQWVEH